MPRTDGPDRNTQRPNLQDWTVELAFFLRELTGLVVDARAVLQQAKDEVVKEARARTKS
jgi:hypothetical protein